MWSDEFRLNVYAGLVVLALEFVLIWIAVPPILWLIDRFRWKPVRQVAVMELAQLLESVTDHIRSRADLTDEQRVQAAQGARDLVSRDVLRLNARFSMYAHGFDSHMTTRAMQFFTALDQFLGLFERTSTTGLDAFTVELLYDKPYRRVYEALQEMVRKNGIVCDESDERFVRYLSFTQGLVATVLRPDVVASRLQSPRE